MLRHSVITPPADAGAPHAALADRRASRLLTAASLIVFGTAVAAAGIDGAVAITFAVSVVALSAVATLFALTDAADAHDGAVLELDRAIAHGLRTDDPSVQRRLERLSTFSYRRRLAGRLSSLVARARRSPRAEVYQVWLVRARERRLHAVAAALCDPAVSPYTAARITLFLHDPASPLLTRAEDEQRFDAWLRGVEHAIADDLGLPTPAGRAFQNGGVARRRMRARWQGSSDERSAGVVDPRRAPRVASDAASVPADQPQ